MASPRSVAGDFPTPRTGAAPFPLLQRQPAPVEAAAVELVAELLQRALRVGLEDVRDDGDLAVVVERQVDVRVRDEIDGDAVARRAADCQADRAAGRARGEQPERRREDRTWA